MKDLEECLSMAQILLKTTDVNVIHVVRHPTDTAPFEILIPLRVVVHDLLKALFHIVTDYDLRIYFDDAGVHLS